MKNFIVKYYTLFCIYIIYIIRRLLQSLAGLDANSGKICVAEVSGIMGYIGLSACLLLLMSPFLQDPSPVNVQSLFPCLPLKSSFQDYLFQSSRQISLPPLFPFVWYIGLKLEEHYRTNCQKYRVKGLFPDFSIIFQCHQ